MTRDNPIEWYGAGNGGFWQWNCPNNHCPYFCWSGFKFIIRIKRRYHMRGMGV